MPNVERRTNPALETLPSNIAWLTQSRLSSKAAARGERALGVHGAREIETIFWRIIAYGTRPGRPRGLLLAWLRWERLANFIWPTQRVPGARHDLLDVRMVPYHGENLTLPDRTEIVPGVIVGELHCNNLALLELMHCNRNPYCAACEDLRSLALWITQPGFEADVRAFSGLTLLANAAARVGFTVRKWPINMRLRLERVFMVGLLLLYTVDGLAHIDRGTTARTYPREVWLSRRELIRRYGSRGASLVE